MRPCFHFANLRVLLLALLALLAAQAPPAAAQQAAIGYTKRVFTDPAVTERNETNTRIVTQHWDSAGQLLATTVCRAPGICNHTIPRGSARYAMVVEYDGAREELMASSCNEVPDTVPQGQCINARLNVSMRVRFGEVRWRYSADPRPNRPHAAPFGGQFGPTPRMEYPSTDSIDPVKWWSPTKYVNRGGTTLGGVLTPVGTYELKLDPMRGHCKPVHTNPNERLTVREGQLTEFTVRYTGTVCTMSVQSYGTSADRVPDSAGTFTSDPAGLSCNANPNARTCKAEFPFDSTVRLIGNPQPGYTSSFGRNFTGCSRDEPDPRICQILVDGDRELSSTMYATAAPPPPPPPVTLTITAGPAALADAEVAKGSTDVPMLQLLLTPANGPVRLQSLTLQASGSGRDDLDLREVRVYADRNNDGSVDADEPLLARGSLSADNGSLRLALAAPLALSEATTLVVVADIAGSVHSAAAAAAAGGLTLALGAVGWVRGRRARPRCAAPGVLVLALLLAACGGDGDDPGAAPADAPSPAPVLSPPPAPPPAPAPPVLLTYRLQLTAVQATDTAATPANLSVSALPLSGAQITVAQ